MSGGRQTSKHLGQYLFHWRQFRQKAEFTSPWHLNSTRALGGTDKRNFSSTLQVQHPYHTNPGNFANRSKDEMREIGRKGGQKGGRATGVGGFHDMDPSKQREIASKGGKASSRAFTKESKQAGDTGRKRGRPRKSSSPSREEYEDVFI